MRIKKLELFTNELVKERKFYTNTLGFKLIHNSENSFTIKVGWSELSFTHSEREHQYHYCFLLPSNKLHEAKIWMEQRHEVLAIDGDRKVQHFESWNADSFYFFDASGNLAEFIVRHNLENHSAAKFDISQVLCVNEIGLPSSDIEKLNSELKKISGTDLWLGDLERFGTHGSDEGMFLLANTQMKENWFPTNMPIIKEPLSTVIQNGKELFQLNYDKGKVVGSLL